MTFIMESRDILCYHLSTDNKSVFGETLIVLHHRYHSVMRCNYRSNNPRSQFPVSAAAT